MNGASPAVEASRVFDNPGVGRLVRDHLPPRRFGRIFFFHGLFLASVLGGMVYLQRLIEPVLDLSLTRLQLGAVALLEILLASALPPFWFWSLTQAERKAACFDEVAVTGVSPLALFGGRYAACLVVTTLAIAEAIPAYVLVILCGGGTFGEAASLLAVTFAAAATSLSLGLAVALAGDDQVVAPLALSLGFLIWLGMVPRVPDAVASAFPTRAVLCLFAADIERFGGPVLGPAHIFGLTVAPWLYTILWMAALALPCLAYVVVGPELTFRPGYSDFNAMAPVGWTDERIRRAPFGKLITKLLQMRALYESMPRRLVAWTPAIRVGCRLLAIAAVSVLALGLLPTDAPPRFGGGPAAPASPGTLVTTAIVLMGLIGFLGVLPAGRVREVALDRRKAFPGTRLDRLWLEALALVLALLIPIGCFLGGALLGGYDLEIPAGTLFDASLVVVLSGLLVGLFAAALGLLLPTAVEGILWGAFGSLLVACIPLSPFIIESSVQMSTGRLVEVMSLSPFVAMNAIAKPGEPILWAFRDADGVFVERSVDPTARSFFILAAVLIPLLLAAVLLLLRRARRAARAGEEGGA